MDINLDTAHKHCVFMNSFSRPPRNELLKCFEENTGVLYGNDVTGFRYNIRMMSKLTHPTILPNTFSESQKLKIFSECYKKYSNALTNEDIDDFWRCVELKVDGFHPSFFNWNMVYPVNKKQLTAKCRNETNLSDEDYYKLCSKKVVNDANLAYLLCLGRVTELNNGHCYYADKGIATLMTKYDRKAVETVVKKCISLVLDSEIFDFKKYYTCIFNSNLFGDNKCFV